MGLPGYAIATATYPGRGEAKVYVLPPYDAWKRPSVGGDQPDSGHDLPPASAPGYRVTSSTLRRPVPLGTAVGGACRGSQGNSVVCPHHFTAQVLLTPFHGTVMVALREVVVDEPRRAVPGCRSS